MLACIRIALRRIAKQSVTHHIITLRRAHMDIRPAYDKLMEAAQDGRFRTAPVSTELLSDMTTPVEVMRRLRNVSSHCYMLESVYGHEKWGRYTFLGYAPKLEITCIDGHMKVGELSFETDDPGKYIQQVLDENRSAKFEGMPSFTGGLVGYFSYDYLKYSEKTLRLDAKDTEGFKDVDLMLFDKVIAFDNFSGKLILIVNISLDAVETEYNRAVIELGKMVELVTNGRKAEIPAGHMKTELKLMFTQKEYSERVAQIKDHIKEGDIFQAVLSNRLEAEYEGSLFDTYRMLRSLNPSPYMFYFQGSDMEVAGASPETLVKLEDGVLHTFPLAGTRPRGKTDEEDKALERELLADEKELSEHNMLVDLGRNDIGKISRFGSVKVEKYHCIERYSHVMHIGSTVRGEIAEGKNALDAISSVLPAGTLSGAPKIRACQLLNDIEDNKRGIYGGAIGYLDLTGNMDTCIAIRIAYRKNGHVFVRSGAGIVADSIPENEYRECMNKAAAVVKALQMAEGIVAAGSGKEAQI